MAAEAQATHQPYRGKTLKLWYRDWGCLSDQVWHGVLCAGSFLPDLHRHSSLEVAAHWTAEDGEILPEYKKAYDAICVSPQIMRDSVQQKQLRYLDVAAKSHPAGLNVRTVFCDLVALAFGVTKSHAERRSFSVPGLCDGNLFQLAMQFYNYMRWERPYVQAAAYEILKSENAGDSMIVLGLLGRGAQQCDARRRFAFSALLNYVPGARGEAVSTDDGEDKELTPDVAKHKAYLLLFEAIDSIKEKALRSVFEEPTKLYFNCVGDHTMEGDTVVHGSNTYLALLMATLGIRLPRTPLLSDDGKRERSLRDRVLAANPSSSLTR